MVAPIRKLLVANRGEIVVALIGEEATVKTYYPENGHIRLQPENETMQPIIIRRDDPDVRIVEQQNKGMGGGNNAGMRVADGRYFFLLNSDSLL